MIFTQLGPNFPFGGMNESGLVVEALWLETSQKPQENSRPAVNESQYIQYILDMAQNVDEAIKLSSQLQVSRAFAPVHYFMCDEAQVCAVAEMTSRGLRFKKISDLSQQMIENAPHSEMLESHSKNKLYASFIKHRSQIQSSSVKSSFEWLEEVKTPGWSRWQVVYDLGKSEFQQRNWTPDQSRAGDPAIAIIPLSILKSE